MAAIHHSKITATMLAAVLVLVAAGCSRSQAKAVLPPLDSVPPSSEPTGTTATTATITSTTTFPIDPADPNADVLMVVSAWFAATDAATGIPDPNFPGLAEAAQGEALEYARLTLAELVYRGQQSFGPRETVRVVVANRNDSAADVYYCTIDRGSLVDKATGKRLDDGSVKVHQGGSAIVTTTTGWKVDHGIDAPDSVCDGVQP